MSVADHTSMLGFLGVVLVIVGFVAAGAILAWQGYGWWQTGQWPPLSLAALLEGAGAQATAVADAVPFSEGGEALRWVLDQPAAFVVFVTLALLAWLFLGIDLARRS